MPETTYTYTISSALPGGKVNSAKLHTEIGKSAIVTALDRIDTEGGTVSEGVITGGTLKVVFKAALSTGDKTILDNDADNPAGGLLAAHDNTVTKDNTTPVEIVNAPSHPAQIVNAGAPIAEQALFATHNFCDPSTWWQMALRVTGAAMTRGTQGSGTGRVYSPTTAITDTIINAHAGKINQEDTEPGVIAHRFRVYVDGVRKKVANAFATAYPDTSNWSTYGAECQVDWATGTVYLKDDVDAGAVVTIDYSKHNPALPTWLRSRFIILAPTKRNLKVLRAETQFSTGVPINDHTLFSGNAPLSYGAVQTDNTFDPGIAPPTSTRVRIDNAASLHANFGTIWLNAAMEEVALGNGDIVEFDTQRKWGILFDASASAEAHAVVTQDGVAVGMVKWNGSAWVAPTSADPSFVEPWGVRKVFKGLQDFLNEATGNCPPVAAGSVSGPGGSPLGFLQIPWDWVGTKLLEDAHHGMIVIWLENGVPHGNGGTDPHFITATIYCRVLDENGN